MPHPTSWRLRGLRASVSNSPRPQPHAEASTACHTVRLSHVSDQPRRPQNISVACFLSILEVFVKKTDLLYYSRGKVIASGFPLHTHAYYKKYWHSSHCSEEWYLQAKIHGGKPTCLWTLEQAKTFSRGWFLWWSWTIVLLNQYLEMR